MSTRPRWRWPPPTEPSQIGESKKGRGNPAFFIRRSFYGSERVAHMDAVHHGVDVHIANANAIEEGAESCGAHVPDLPGCIAVAESREEVVRLTREAIELHVQALLEQGETMPLPSSSIEYVYVAA